MIWTSEKVVDCYAIQLQSVASNHARVCHRHHASDIGQPALAGKSPARLPWLLPPEWCTQLADLVKVYGRALRIVTTVLITPQRLHYSTNICWLTHIASNRSTSIQRSIHTN